MTDAPLVEQNLWRAVHVYERVKFAIVSVTMVVVLAIGVLLLVGQASQHKSLLILECAVAQEVQDARSKAGSNIPLRDVYARQAYEACVKRGHPLR